MIGALVLREGDTRPPLLLLHGFAGAPASWRAVAARLDPARCSLAVALPGHDPARPLPSPCGFLDAVRALGAELDAAREEVPGDRGPWHLAGYSMGARVGLALLLERPELFCGASLVGLHPGLPTEAERQARRNDDRAWIELLRGEGVRAFAAAWESRPLFASQASLPDEARAAQSAIRRTHDAEQLARALETFGLGAMPDLFPRVASIGVPVTLVAGGDDAKFAALARRVLPALALGNLVTLDGVGHNPLLERPDAVAALLSRVA
jgi:2-succinyl-6-hydroxy-2,4-cyclohexadiene-1-carboxylate synthase